MYRTCGSGHWLRYVWMLKSFLWIPLKQEPSEMSPKGLLEKWCSLLEGCLVSGIKQV